MGFFYTPHGIKKKLKFGPKYHFLETFKLSAPKMAQKRETAFYKHVLDLCTCWNYAKVNSLIYIQSVLQGEYHNFSFDKIALLLEP
jgi:hypothetical protein